MNSVLLIAGLIIFAYLPFPMLVKIWLRKRFLAGMRGASVVCLTFDEGPDPDSTPPILELLDRYQAKATFFLLGRNAVRHPRLVKDIMASGHEIGEHSDRHTHAWKCGPFATATDLINGGRSISSVAGGPVPWFRPPYGKLNIISLLYIVFGRKRVAFWDIDPKDYAADSAAQVCNETFSSLRNGRVLLLHDGRTGESNDKGVTVSALEGILAEGTRRGLTFGSVSQALNQVSM